MSGRQDAIAEAGAHESKGKLSGWLKSKAATLGEHVQEMRDNTKLIARDVADGVKESIARGRLREERFDATFVEKPLGLELDLQRGALVRLVKAGGQAERLTIAVNDRLVAIAGEQLPEPPDPGGKGVDEFIQVVQGRLSAMKRPVALTFARVVEDTPAPKTKSSASSTATGGASGDTSGELLDAVKLRIPKIGASSTAAELQAELAAAKSALQRYECDAALAREDATAAAAKAEMASKREAQAIEEANKLRADLADLQLSRAWGSQESTQSHEEAQIARIQADEARAELANISEELQRSVAAHAQAEQAALAQARAAQEQLAELQRQLSTTQQDQNIMHEDEVRQLREELKSSEAQAAQSEARAVAAEETCQQLSAQLADAKDAEISAARSAADATGKIDVMKEEVQRRDIAVVKSESLIKELKREVERLRAEVRRLEDAVAATEPSAASKAAAIAAEAQAAAERRASAAEAEATSLAEEVRKLTAVVQDMSRSRVAVINQSSGSGTSPDPDLLGKAASEEHQEGETTSVPNGGGRSAGHCVGSPDRQPTSESLDLLSGDASAAGPGDDVDARAPERELTTRELQARVVDLETRNANLMKQLGNRPIVYQFGPLPGEDLDDQDDDDDDEEADLLRNSMTAATAPVGFGPPPSMVDKLLLTAKGNCLWLKRKATRGVGACRRTGLAKQLEQKLRAFTNKMLTRPLLLWIFYIHVAVLWIIGVYCQGRYQPTIYDPSNKLEVAMASRSKGR